MTKMQFVLILMAVALTRASFASEQCTQKSKGTCDQLKQLAEIAASTEGSQCAPPPKDQNLFSEQVAKDDLMSLESKLKRGLSKAVAAVDKGKCPDGCQTRIPNIETQAIPTDFLENYDKEEKALCGKLLVQTEKKPIVKTAKFIGKKRDFKECQIQNGETAMKWMQKNLGDKNGTFYEKCPDPCSFTSTVTSKSVRTSSGCETTLTLAVVCGHPRKGTFTGYNAFIKGTLQCRP